MNADQNEGITELATPLLAEGEPGFRRMCLRTFEPANARRDAARRAGRGACEAGGVVGVESRLSDFDWLTGFQDQVDNADLPSQSLRGLYLWRLSSQR